MFSTRTSWDTAESNWSRALVARRASGLPLHDLTSANPTECGFDYDPSLLDSLTNTSGLHYTADPLGLFQAREAVCTYYQDHQRLFTPDDRFHLAPRQVLLTASTSEAYSFLFRLLCDAGDEVLIAQPGYPLFDFLADLDDVRLISYPVFYDHGWHLDLHALRERMTNRTRAIVIVHPNNPTGHYTRPQDREALEKLAVEHNLALIIDEVFLDYSFGKAEPSFALGEHRALTFVLSGLSKVIGLPQMKLSWISSYGPSAILEPALARLEVIADTFLSVSSPVQHATPVWLAGRLHMQSQMRQRTAGNLHWLDDALQTQANINRLQVEGGWYAILRVPSLQTSEETAIQLLKHAGVVVHPGSFFGMNDSPLLVLSLVAPPEIFRVSVRELLLGLDAVFTNS